MTLDLARMQTRLTEAFITKMVAANPSILLPSGNLRLPPARLSFPNLAKKGTATNDDGTPREGSFGANLLFTPDADLTAAAMERKKKLAEFFPTNPTGAGMKSPFRDQADRVAPSEGGQNVKGKTTTGYVPGAKVITPNANRRPSLSTLVNGKAAAFLGSDDEIEKTFYAGCWVVPFVNVFHGRNAKNPGAFFGLQGVLKVCDDTEFGGTSMDMNEAAAGLTIDGSFDPASSFSTGTGEPEDIFA